MKYKNMTLIRYKRKNFQAVLVNLHRYSDIAYCYSEANFFLLSLSPLTKEELNAHESLEYYN